MLWFGSVTRVCPLPRAGGSRQHFISFKIHRGLLAALANNPHGPSRAFQVGPPHNSTYLPVDYLGKVENSNSMQAATMHWLTSIIPSRQLLASLIVCISKISRRSVSKKKQKTKKPISKMAPLIPEKSKDWERSRLDQTSARRVCVGVGFLKRCTNWFYFPLHSFG